MQQLQDAGRDVNPWQRILRAGLQQDHLRTGLAQTSGDDATGGAGTDDDVVSVHLPQPRFSNGSASPAKKRRGLSCRIDWISCSLRPRCFSIGTKSVNR